MTRGSGRITVFPPNKGIPAPVRQGRPADSPCPPFSKDPINGPTIHAGPDSLRRPLGSFFFHGLVAAASHTSLGGVSGPIPRQETERLPNLSHTRKTRSGLLGCRKAAQSIWRQTQSGEVRAEETREADGHSLAVGFHRPRRFRRRRRVQPHRTFERSLSRRFERQTDSGRDY